MEKATAKDIVRSVRLSSEIEAHLTNPQDLDGDKLYDIFIQIQHHIGEKQANAFVSMVRTLDPLTPVNILYSLYQLEKLDWDIYSYNYSRNKTIDAKNYFLRKLGEEKGPREREKVNCKNDDFER